MTQVYTPQEIETIKSEVDATIDQTDAIERGIRNCYIADLWFGKTRVSFEEYAAAYSIGFDDVVEDQAEYWANGQQWAG